MPTQQSQSRSQLTPAQILQQWVDETTTLAGFADLPADFQKPYKDKLVLALHKKIGTVLNNRLQDDDVKELAEFLEANPKFTPEDIFKFYDSKIFNLPETVADIMRSFQQEFLNTVLKVEAGVGII